MVHKPKNNKRSRAIAARKLLRAAEAAEAAAAAVAAEASPESAAHELPKEGSVHPPPSRELWEHPEEAAAAQPTPAHDAAFSQPCLSDDAHRGATLTGEAPQWTAGALQDALRLPRDGAVSAHDLATVTAASTDRSVLDRVPRLRAVTLLPPPPASTPLADAAAAAAPHHTPSTPPPLQRYVAYLLTDTSSPPGCEAPSSMWGVYACGTHACLQVVHWRPIADGAGDRELLMHVDAAGRCFVLATESLVSTHHGHPPPTALVPGPPSPTAPPTEAYWLVPSHIADDCLALLRAREWLRATAALPAGDAPCHGGSAQPHPTRWVPQHVESGDAADAAVPVERPASPRRPTSKARKAASRAARPAPPPAAAVPGPTPEDASCLSGISPYRIPYVAAVTCSAHLDENAAPTTEAPSADVRLLLGNVLRAYPTAAM